MIAGRVLETQATSDKFRPPAFTEELFGRRSQSSCHRRHTGASRALPWAQWAECMDRPPLPSVHRRKPVVQATSCPIFSTGPIPTHPRPNWLRRHCRGAVKPWEIQTPKPSRTSDSKRARATSLATGLSRGFMLSSPEPTTTHRNSLAFPGPCWHSLGFLQLTPALASKPVPSIKTQPTRNTPAHLRTFASIARAVFHVASSILPTSPRTSRGIA